MTYAAAALLLSFKQGSVNTHTRAAGGLPCHLAGNKAGPRCQPPQAHAVARHGFVLRRQHIAFYINVTTDSEERALVQKENFVKKCA